MPKFISVHVTTCMTRQDLNRLVQRFLADSTEMIRSTHVHCDTVSGRMVCEWEAPDRDALIDWLAQRNVKFRGSEEWLIRVQMETRDGQVVPADS